MDLCKRCQSPLDSPTEACAVCGYGTEGDLLDGKYRLERELGRGGMGVVHLARDVMLDRPVAIKMLLPEEQYTPEQLVGFRREAASLASVRNENVVHVYSFGVHQGHPFFAMEFVRGTALGMLIAQHTRHQSRVPLHRALTILEQVARGLDAVHRAGVLHRDVKPDNILIEEGTGRPVLIDFGLVNLLRGRPIEGNAEGTPDYMAPEAWQPALGEITVATDIYSLGCTVYELLTGRPPFVDAQGTSALMSAHLVRHPVPLSAFAAELAPFEPIVRRAMAKKPAERFQRAIDLVTALHDAAPPAVRPELPSRTLSPASEGPLRATEILVIDDDPIFQRVIARAAQIAFYGRPPHIQVVGSGNEALTYAAAHRLDLVLLDYHMPDLNGLDTLSRLRALKDGTQARVIVVSGAARSIERWPFAVLGVQDFYDKSGGLPLLVELITQVAEQMGLRPPDVQQP